jgi:hypothetical protein
MLMAITGGELLVDRATPTVIDGHSAESAYSRRSINVVSKEEAQAFGGLIGDECPSDGIELEDWCDHELKGMLTTYKLFAVRG